jgi:VWFA-related protein
MRCASAVFAALLAGGVVSAQTAQAPPASSPQAPATMSPPTFRSRTQLLVVDVSVLDNTGRPVPNLAAKDFQVKLDGVLRPVRAVTYAQIEGKADAHPTRVSSSPTRTVTNIAMTSPQRRVVVILVDDLSLGPSRGKSMLAAAARFVSGLPDVDLVGLTSTSRTVNINPTIDHGAIATALPHVVGEFWDPRTLLGPPVGIEEAVAIRDGDDSALQNAINRDCYSGATPPVSFHVDSNQCSEEVGQKARAMGAMAEGNALRQLEAYREVIGAMRAAPGLKQLVVISDGLAVAHRSDGGASLLEPIARAAAMAGVQVSMLCEDAPLVDLADVDHAHAGSLAVTNSGSTITTLRRDDDAWMRSGAQTIADMAGGTYYHVIGGADRSFDRVNAASSALYQLGVETPPDSPPGHDYALSIKMTRPGLAAHANRHALSPPAADAVPATKQLQQAIATGAPLYAVPLTVGTAVRRGDIGDQVNLDVNVEVPSTSRGPLTVVFGLGDRSGLVQTGTTTIPGPSAGGDYRASLVLPISPGTYRLRFAVADSDDKVGSVETRVSAELNQVGPFFTSDLLTGWSGADHKPQFLALERVPAGADTLLAALELYPPVGETVPEDLKVRMTLMASDESSIAETEVVPTATNDTLRVDTHFLLKNLTPDTYTLRATVLVRNRPLGSISTTIRTSGAGQ